MVRWKDLGGDCHRARFAGGLILLVAPDVEAIGFPGAYRFRITVFGQRLDYGADTIEEAKRRAVKAAKKRLKGALERLK